jgi:Glycosyl hydrolase catalytic core
MCRFLFVCSQFAILLASYRTAATPADNKFSPAQVLAFMKVVLPWLEAQPWIAGYAWFPFKKDFGAGTSSALFELDGTTLTPLGNFYASVSNSKPSGNQAITV